MSTASTQPGTQPGVPTVTRYDSAKDPRGVNHEPVPQVSPTAAGMHPVIIDDLENVRAILIAERAQRDKEIAEQLEIDAETAGSWVPSQCFYKQKADGVYRCIFCKEPRLDIVRCKHPRNAAITGDDVRNRNKSKSDAKPSGYLKWGGGRK
ncbi:MAG TPA: hypothetical protein VJ553_05515 [Candidatus Paceibacterota bacterium]|nr:hypothetical protein [Candidatus Paceibacterota bacterium]